MITAREAPARLASDTTADKQAAFTMLELLIALSIGAMILAALASSTQVFGANIEYLRDDPQRELEQSLTNFTTAVRHAWVVEKPSDTELRIVDALGNATRFELDGSTIRVHRPNGAAGVLLEGVSDCAFELETMQRLREADPRALYGPLFSDLPLGTPSERVLEDGEAISLGFTVPALAPATVETVDGVNEQLLESTLDRVLLPLARVDGSFKEFCHLHAPGPPHNPSHPDDTGLLTIELYEARAPGSAETYGPALASMDIPTAALPTGTHTWWDHGAGGTIIAPEVIDPPAGVAWGWWDGHPNVELVLDTPAVDAPIDLSAMGAVVYPGKSYTLVARVSGLDFVVLETVPAPGVSYTAVATQSAPGAPFIDQPLAVRRTIEGLATYTQTNAFDVIRQVSVTLERDDGSAFTGSALVTTQAASSNPWHGAVPGELPTLLTPGS